jgi:hypothetical protein
MKAIRFFWQEKSVHHVTFEQRQKVKGKKNKSNEVGI